MAPGGNGDLGNSDLWSLAAYIGFPIILTCEKLTGTFTPHTRLCGRNGTVLAKAQNAALATLNFPGTNSSSFTALIDGAGDNDTGT